MPIEPEAPADSKSAGVLRCNEHRGALFVVEADGSFGPGDHQVVEMGLHGGQLRVHRLAQRLRLSQPFRRVTADGLLSIGHELVELASLPIDKRLNRSSSRSGPRASPSVGTQQAAAALEPYVDSRWSWVSAPCRNGSQCRIWYGGGR